MSKKTTRRDTKRYHITSRSYWISPIHEALFEEITMPGEENEQKLQGLREESFMDCLDRCDLMRLGESSKR